MTVECPYCGKKFGKKRAYNQHLSRSHKKEWNKKIEKLWKEYKNGARVQDLARREELNPITLYIYFRKLRKKEEEKYW